MGPYSSNHKRISIPRKSWVALDPLPAPYWGGGGGGGVATAPPDLKKKIFPPLIVLHSSYRCKLLMDLFLASHSLCKMLWIQLRAPCRRGHIPLPHPPPHRATRSMFAPPPPPQSFFFFLTCYPWGWPTCSYWKFMPPQIVNFGLQNFSIVLSLDGSLQRIILSSVSLCKPNPPILL